MARTLDIVAFGSVSDWLAEQLGWLWVGNSPILLTPGSFYMGWSVLPVSCLMRSTDWIYMKVCLYKPPGLEQWKMMGWSKSSMMESLNRWMSGS